MNNYYDKYNTFCHTNWGFFFVLFFSSYFVVFLLFRVPIRGHIYFTVNKMKWGIYTQEYLNTAYGWIRSNVTAKWSLFTFTSPHKLFLSKHPSYQIDRLNAVLFHCCVVEGITAAYKSFRWIMIRTIYPDTDTLQLR